MGEWKLRVSLVWMFHGLCVWYLSQCSNRTFFRCLEYVGFGSKWRCAFYFLFIYIRIKQSQNIINTSWPPIAIKKRKRKKYLPLLLLKLMTLSNGFLSMKNVPWTFWSIAVIRKTLSHCRNKKCTKIMRHTTDNLRFFVNYIKIVKLCHWISMCEHSCQFRIYWHWFKIGWNDTLSGVWLQFRKK